MIYKIKYNYDTGDSFNQYPGQEGYLEIGWTSQQKAEENLRRIEEHYKQYKRLNSRWDREDKTNQEIIKESEDKDWLVKKTVPVAHVTEKGGGIYILESEIQKHVERGVRVEFQYDEMAAENQIILYADNGNPFQFWAPWCGYFEHLNYVEVTSENLKIEF